MLGTKYEPYGTRRPMGTPIMRSIPTAKLIANGIYGIDIGSLVPEWAVTRLKYPGFVIHGTADKRVPWEQGQRVAEAAKEGSTLLRMILGNFS